LEAVLPFLNERQRRLLCAAEARQLGHGGIAAATPTQPPVRRARPGVAHSFDAALATHPVLTCTSRDELDQLVVQVRDLIDALPPEQRPRHRKLTVENTIWAAVLDQRGLPGSLLAHLFRIGENQMRAHLQQARPLLQQHDYRAEPLFVHLVDPCELARYAMRTT
jgi:hypothetical protein